MEESHNHMLNKIRPDTKEHLLYGFIYIKYKSKQVQFMLPEVRMVFVLRGGSSNDRKGVWQGRKESLICW